MDEHDWPPFQQKIQRPSKYMETHRASAKGGGFPSKDGKKERNVIIMGGGGPGKKLSITPISFDEADSR